MSRAHRLHWLSFSAVGSAPERPIILGTNRIARVPELRCDPAVAGILKHACFFAGFDFPADLCRELKLVPAVIDGPGTIRLHEDSVVGVRDQIVKFPGARFQADVGHADYRQAIPAFCAHGAG